MLGQKMHFARETIGVSILCKTNIAGEKGHWSTRQVVYSSFLGTNPQSFMNLHLAKA